MSNNFQVSDLFVIQGLPRGAYLRYVLKAEKEQTPFLIVSERDTAFIVWDSGGDKNYYFPKSELNKKSHFKKV